jgi:hypothetical protein
MVTVEPAKALLDKLSCSCRFASTDHNETYQESWRYGQGTTISRTGFFKQMASKSYWIYGKVNQKDGALIPEGRILIDTARSFVYAESSMKVSSWPPGSPAISESHLPLHARHAHLQLRDL